MAQFKKGDKVRNKKSKIAYVVLAQTGSRVRVRKISHEQLGMKTHTTMWDDNLVLEQRVVLPWSEQGDLTPC